MRYISKVARTRGFIAYFFILSSILSLPTAPAAKSGAEKKIPVVYLAEAQPKELFDNYSYPARVIPLVSADVLSEADGVVHEVFAPLGTPVKRGQKIISIRHTDPVYQYAKAVVRAPVSGIVSRFHIQKGTHVKRGQELLTVTDPKQVKVSVEVAAVDLPVIRRGLKANFRASGQDASVPLEVTGVSPFVDPRTGTATCELAVPDGIENNSLYPGIVGQVNFRANERRGFVVPDIAIYYQGKKPLLRIVNADSVSNEVPVTLGKRERGTVEILSGLNPGDRYVQRSSRFVANGQKVTIQDQKQKPASEEKKATKKETKKG